MMEEVHHVHDHNHPGMSAQIRQEHHLLSPQHLVSCNHHDLLGDRPYHVVHDHHQSSYRAAEHASAAV